MELVAEEEAVQAGEESDHGADDGSDDGRIGELDTNAMDDWRGQGSRYQAWWP